ncbi:DUF4163 domain-containing protein [Flavobacteriaceae bacterium AU392]|nr:DUF3298/DUF4163 domain-containing protein [Flavobacteriaceae bacterium]RKM84689.1 DUF4163 domain-containing protein [Flavobacteriaceae bacterium AU392]
MKKKIFLIVISLTVFSCKKEVPITFSEIELKYNDLAMIEINIPKAEGNTENASMLNSKIQNHIANTLNYVEDYIENLKLETAIEVFNNEYSSFKANFEDSELIWEAIFDGEITYQSSEIISIPITSYLNTGGAHGSLNVTFLNFDPESGNLLSFEEFIEDINGFKTLAKTYFEKKFGITNDKSFEDYFFGQNFLLPENIGFNDEGILLFYNVYEIASYTDGPTEFTIPFDEVQSYLKIN